MRTEIQNRNTERPIAVRGFINERFNTTYGKGLFRRALFTGSIELRDPNQKYLVDLYHYVDWQHSAKTDEEIEVLKKLDAVGMDKSPDAVMSWIKHYDPLTKAKTVVNGYAVYMPSTGEMYVEISDPANGTVDSWFLDARNCNSTGINKPVFIAANIDLN
jgi:hypothetical protein